MSIEMRMLAYSIILGFVQLAIAVQSSMSQRTLKWKLSPRDEKVPELFGIPARLNRAYQNFLETFPFFLAAVLLISITKTSTSVSALGAQLYFFSRVIYVPSYAFGIPLLRSFVWFTAMAGILLVLIPLF